jgi:hypothetical protein
MVVSGIRTKSEASGKRALSLVYITSRLKEQGAMRRKKQEIWNERTVRLEIMPAQKPQEISSRSPYQLNSKSQEVWNQPTVLLGFLHTERQDPWNQATVRLMPPELERTQGFSADTALLEKEPILFVARRPWLRRCWFLGATFSISTLLLWLQSAFYGISPRVPDWHAGIQWGELKWAIPVLLTSVLCLGWLFFAEREKKQGDILREILQLLVCTFGTGIVVAISIIIPLLVLLIPALPQGWNPLLLAFGILAAGEFAICAILIKTTPRLKGQLLRSEYMETVRRPLAFDVFIRTTYNGNEVKDPPLRGRAISTRLTGMLVLADMPTVSL